MPESYGDGLQTKVPFLKRIAKITRYFSASTAKKNQLNFQGNLAACFFRFYSYNPSCGNTYSLRQLWTLLLISRKYCHGVLKDEKTDFILYLSRKWFYATFFECSFSVSLLRIFICIDSFSFLSTIHLVSRLIYSVYLKHPCCV